MKRLFILLVLLTGCQRQDFFEKYENTKIQVSILGEVCYPGTYELEIGSTLKDLVDKAGGFTLNADNHHDLTRKVKNYEEIIVVDKSENKININTANQQQLENLEGVGKTLATRIIEYRNANGAFKDIDDLKKVKGFSEKKYQKIYSFIKIR